jgi:MFS family permease
VTPPPVAADYAEALDNIGLGRFSLKIFLLAGLGWISDGAEAAVLSYMLPALRQQHGLQEADLGAISSLLSGAQALGAMFWGYCADTLGRRPSFLASVGLTALLGMASAASGGSLEAYVLLRALTGFAIGGNLPLAVTVTSELLPPRYRDRALVGLHLFYEAGALTSTGLALLFMPDSCKPDTRCAWPLYLALVAAPAACVSLLAVCHLPESPVWLGSKGRHTEARAVLALAVRGGRTSGAGAAPLEAAPPVCGSAEARGALQAAPEEEEAPRAVREGGAGAARGRGACCVVPPSFAAIVRTLFGPALLPTTLLVCALWLTADAASGWWTWLPELASRQGVPALNMYLSSIVGRVVASGAFLVAPLL